MAVELLEARRRREERHEREGVAAVGLELVGGGLHGAMVTEAAVEPRRARRWPTWQCVPLVLASPSMNWRNAKAMERAGVFVGKLVTVTVQAENETKELRLRLQR